MTRIRTQLKQDVQWKPARQLPMGWVVRNDGKLFLVSDYGANRILIQFPGCDKISCSKITADNFNNRFAQLGRLPSHEELRTGEVDTINFPIGYPIQDVEPGLIVDQLGNVGLYSSEDDNPPDYVTWLETGQVTLASELSDRRFRPIYQATIVEE